MPSIPRGFLAIVGFAIFAIELLIAWGSISSARAQQIGSYVSVDKDVLVEQIFIMNEYLRMNRETMGNLMRLAGEISNENRQELIKQEAILAAQLSTTADWLSMTKNITNKRLASIRKGLNDLKEGRVNIEEEDLSSKIPLIDNFECPGLRSTKKQEIVEVILNEKRTKLLCDNEGKAGFVIQQRLNGSVDFYKGWDDYVKGFGDFHGEFWLGLETISAITSSGHYYLNIELTDRYDDVTQVEYDDFVVGGEDTKFKLINAGVALPATNDAFNNPSNGTRQTGAKFSTKDHDNDGIEQKSCAVANEGAWWFSNDCLTDLNAPRKFSGQGIRWGGTLNHLTATKLKVYRFKKAAFEIF